MNVTELMPVLRKYEKCPSCGSSKIGNGEGGIVIDDVSYIRTCKCGYKITIDANGKIVKEMES
ncbi:MAG: DUF3797 domain-containing protein [Clostridiaceae bacterium]